MNEDIKTPEGAAAVPDVNYADKSLAELSELFGAFLAREDRLRQPKVAEAIKSAFYKRLSKEKVEAGLTPAYEPFDEELDEEQQGTAEAPAADAPLAETQASDGPFAAVEQAFKDLYNSYRKERAAYNRQIEQEREQNLAQKQAVIEDLKALLEKQEDVHATFPAFREIQNRWRSIGPVPAAAFRNLNDTYQLYVEQFYDMVEINRELRDIDFKKNLEAKEGFCDAAERLADSENVVDAFNELQKLHEQWKEYGPVDKEHRESIWERFRAASAVVNKQYQAFFEGIKEEQQAHLAAKTALCEQVEEYASREIKSSSEWSALSKSIEDIQKQWKEIGAVPRKESQKIYERFRAACDAFFTHKREYFLQFKDSMSENLEKKEALVREAEELKDSTEWKKTAEKLIGLQKQWKEIGAVPRKKSEQLWTRFRAACDAFFEKRDQQPRENDFYGNLRAKRALVEEVKAYDGEATEEAFQGFMDRWQAIGFVPFKEKDALTQQWREALAAKFPRRNERPRGGFRPGAPRRQPVLSEKDRLVAQYQKVQHEIDNYENNLGFFAKSKNAEALIAQMQEKIDALKAELVVLQGKIRSAEDAEKN